MSRMRFNLAAVAEGELAPEAVVAEDLGKP